MKRAKYSWTTALMMVGGTVAVPFALMAVMPPALAVVLGPVAVALAFFASGYCQSVASESA